MSGSVIHVRHLRKRFGERTALAIDVLDIAEGSLTAVFGPNGAGKTTLIRLVSGLWLPTAQARGARRRGGVGR